MVQLRAQSEVERFLKELEHPQKDQLMRLNQLIRKSHPHLKEKLWSSGSIVGYGSYHYRYKSGHSGEWFIIGFAPRKGYISLYAMAVRDGQYLAQLYKDRLGNVKMGKACINIKDLNSLNQDLLKQFINEAVACMEAYCRKQGWKIGL